MDFANMVVLITGASGGIGNSLAEILHNYGATVIGVYNEHKINTQEYDTYKCDITKEEDIKELFKKVIAKHEKIDVLVNCAAISLDDDIYNKSKEDFLKVLEVNLVGTYLMCKQASLVMEKGVIINIASTNGIDTYNPLSMDYDASKAGLINLTQNLALRFPSLKICALAPNWVDTNSVLNMEPNYLKSELKRIGQDKLIKKEAVAIKIIEIIINDDIKSGDVIRMDNENV